VQSLDSLFPGPLKKSGGPADIVSTSAEAGALIEPSITNYM